LSRPMPQFHFEGTPFLKVSIMLDVEEAEAADRVERAAQRRR